jgi:hypothetical protein
MSFVASLTSSRNEDELIFSLIIREIYTRTHVTTIKGVMNIIHPRLIYPIVDIHSISAVHAT